MPIQRYSGYREGPDPLAEPFDVGAAVDELADRIMAGESVSQALRDLQGQGSRDSQGLDAMRWRIRQRRRELESSGRLDGLLSDVRELLDSAVDLERQALFPDPADDARFREAMLDALPEDTARAVRELSSYDWRSPEAAQTYEEIRQRLQRDVLDQQFKDLSRSLTSPSSPEARKALADMLNDLNAMLEKHQRGEDVGEDFTRFMDRHGEFFPERPETFEQLLDELARRAAAMQRMLDSMSPEQREELMGLMNEAMQDMDIAAQMSRLTNNLKAMRPDLQWQGRQRMTGDEGLGLPDATEALAELSDLESLDEQLGQDYPGASLDDVDEEAVRRALGRQAVDDLQRLRTIERELQAQGYLTRKGDRLELSPKSVRRIGQTALGRVFESLSTGRRGDHDVHATGAAGEVTGQTRAWQFGDEVPIDVVRTVGNAVRRHLMTGGAMGLAADDFEVVETESRSRAAVALLVDQSFSMVMNDTWRAAKTTALALHSLATASYPLDAVQIIAFANLARVVAPHELPDLDASHVQGTNLQHALMLAGQFLNKHHGAEPVVMVITDGEPTAHLSTDGDWSFMWPPDRETITLTVAEVDRLTRRGAPISWFRLGDDPRLEEFLDAMARRNGGRVLAASGERLGDVVVTDYVRARRRRSA